MKGTNQMKNHKSKLNRKINELFENDEKFFELLGRKKETFWKNFDEETLELSMIQKASQILELTPEETGEIFFDETIGQQQATKFYNLMLQIIKKLPEEERIAFLQKFDELFNKLKRK